MKKELLLLCLLFVGTAIQAQYQYSAGGYGFNYVPNNGSAPVLFTSMCQGDGLWMSNHNFVSGQYQYGVFGNDTTQTNLDFSEGFTFSSGSAAAASSYNVSFSSMNITDGQYGLNRYLPGDLDLDTLLWHNVASTDAVFMEMDVTCYGDTLVVEYIYGTEDWARRCTNNPDAMAIFISGPGIIGKKNIATLPDGVTPISMNAFGNVSLGNGQAIPPNSLFSNISNCTEPRGSMAYEHWAYNNWLGSGVEFDLLSIPMEAKQVVIPGATYRLKIVVADIGNAGTYNSGVFINREGIYCKNAWLSDSPEAAAALPMIYKVLPNPNSEGMVHVASNQPFPENASFILYNALGEVLRRIPLPKGDQQAACDLGNLPPAAYFYIIAGDADQHRLHSGVLELMKP